MHLGAVTELKMHGIFLMEETSGMENMFFVKVQEYRNVETRWVYISQSMIFFYLKWVIAVSSKDSEFRSMISMSPNILWAINILWNP